MHAQLHSVPPTLQQATADPCLRGKLLDTRGQVWVSLLWGHCSFLLGRGEHKVLFVPSKSLFLQSFVSSGGVNGDILQEGLCHTQVCCTQRPCLCGSSTADPYLHREALKHSSVSVSVVFLGPGVYKLCLSPLSISGGYGV